MAKRKMAKTSYIITYIIVVLLLVSIAGVIAYFTNGFTSEIKTFYVQCDGVNILTQSDGYLLTPDKPLNADVKYPFEVSEKDKGYTITILPTKDKNNDFEIILNNRIINFQDIENFNDGFEIEQDINKFSIKPKGNINDILKAVFPNDKLDNYKRNVYDNMFTIVVSPLGEKNSIILQFTVEGIVEVEEIIFDNEVIQL